MKKELKWWWRRCFWDNWQRLCTFTKRRHHFLKPWAGLIAWILSCMLCLRMIDINANCDSLLINRQERERKRERERSSFWAPERGRQNSDVLLVQGEICLFPAKDGCKSFKCGGRWCVLANRCPLDLVAPFLIAEGCLQGPVLKMCRRHPSMISRSVDARSCWFGYVFSKEWYSDERICRRWSSVLRDVKWRLLDRFDNLW